METQIKVPHTEYPKIAKKRKAGKTLTFIAEPYGVTRERIRQILKEHFPEITAKIAGQTRKRIFDQKREKETRPCTCGCGTIIPVWKKINKYWAPAPRYVPGHQWRNRVPYKWTPTSRAKLSAFREKAWAEGRYDNKIRKDTIEIRRKLWKILREHPEGMTTTNIVKVTGINRSTLGRWIRVQQYMKFNICRKGKGGRPYIISLARESPVNLEDEMCSPHLNLDIGEKND